MTAGVQHDGSKPAEPQGEVTAAVAVCVLAAILVAGAVILDAILI